MSNYAWIIDQDNLYIPGETYIADESGTTGPSSAPKSLMSALSDNSLETHKFRMYDDDGELYYTGRMVKSSEGYDEEAFAGPLYDFGGPNAGCTRIEYDGMSGAFEY